MKHVVEINRRQLPETTAPDTEFRYVDISACGPGSLVAAPETMRFGDSPSRARRLVRPGDTIVSTVRTNLLGVGPSRSAIEPSLKRLMPVALNLEEHGWGVHGLSEIAATIRTQHAGEPEWRIRRRLREAMNRLKSGKNAFDDGEVSDPVLVELAETDPLQAEA